MFKSMALCAILLGGGISSLSGMTFINVIDESAKWYYVTHVYLIQHELGKPSKIVQNFHITDKPDQVSLLGVFEDIQHHLAEDEVVQIEIRGLQNYRCTPLITISKKTKIEKLDQAKVYFKTSWVEGERLPRTTCKIKMR